MAGRVLRLNAPFGAQCFPTRHGCQLQRLKLDVVSMHLLVLSAFRRNLMVWAKGDKLTCLNAPFGAQCFPTPGPVCRSTSGWVSMHLLVLSAFRHGDALDAVDPRLESQCTFWCSVLSDWTLFFLSHLCVCGLNAPFGAQCFPTSMAHAVAAAALRLNAPFGAQCFPTGTIRSAGCRSLCLNAPFGAQCFPTLG